MAVITLAGNTIGCCIGTGSFESVGSAFSSAKQSVKSLAQGISTLKSKIDIARVAANVDTSHTQAQNAEKREETKQGALSRGYDKLENLISDVGTVDNKAADKIRERKNDFYACYSYLKPDCEKTDKELRSEKWAERWQKIKNFGSKILNGIKTIVQWCKECWEEIVIIIIGIASAIVTAVVIVSTLPYSLLIVGLLSLMLILTSSTVKTTVPYTYDKNSIDSMTECLGIESSAFVDSMASQYGFDEDISKLYLRLYLEVHNSSSMNGKSEKEIACEFNRIIASLCLNYDGSAKRWQLTTDNYSSVDVFQMLINSYGFTKEDAVDFTIAINVQHGNSCKYVEDYFGFSRLESSMYTKGKEPITNDFANISASYGTNPMRDFVHEAIQYVEFNDNLDIIDFASGSTDRMISYSGDIVSGRYDDADFHSDIDANNIQLRLQNENDNFIAVQHKYNYELMNHQTDAKSEFISNNGGIENIRNQIIYDIRHTLAAYIDRGEGDLVGNPKNREEYHQDAVEDFISFLEN